jgi:hypothetical protein
MVGARQAGNNRKHARPPRSGAARQVHVDAICTQLHRAAVVRVVHFGVMRGLLVAAIQPADADRIRRSRGHNAVKLHARSRRCRHY